MNIKQTAKKLTQDIPALYLYIKENKPSFLTKFLAIITITYALSPIDLIPDFIPILGYLDDIIILPFLVFLTLKTIHNDDFEGVHLGGTSWLTLPV